MRMRVVSFVDKITLPFRQIRNWFLVKRFPFLKPSNGYGIDMNWHRNGYKYRYEETWLDCLPRGWRKSFAIQMCKEIKKAIKEGNLTAYTVTQVKEKFGTLCWYDGGANDKIRAITLKYEELTYRICINCGKPAEYVTSRWIGYYCKDCVNKFNLQASKLYDAKENQKN